MRLRSQYGYVDCVPVFMYVLVVQVKHKILANLSAGFSGSAPIACGAGSVGDLFSARDRASAMAVYSLGPLMGMLPVRYLCVERRLNWFIGPVIGPIAGGFIAQTVGIKYVFIVIAGGNLGSVYFLEINWIS